MTRSLALLFLSAAALFAAAETEWDKVKALKSGTEIRILRRGVATEAKFAEASDDSVVVIIKNEQKAFPKDEIQRLDARLKAGSRMTTESKTTTEPPDTRPQTSPAQRPSVPGQSTSTGVSFGGKPPYETIYRRVVHSPANATEKPASASEKK
jgi:hypothetical protein